MWHSQLQWVPPSPHGRIVWAQTESTFVNVVRNTRTSIPNFSFFVMLWKGSTLGVICTSVTNLPKLDFRDHPWGAMCRAMPICFCFEKLWLSLASRRCSAARWNPIYRLCHCTGVGRFLDHRPVFLVAWCLKLNLGEIGPCEADTVAKLLTIRNHVFHHSKFQFSIFETMWVLLEKAV